MKDFKKTADAIVANYKSELPSARNSLKGLSEKLEKISQLTPLLEEDLNEALNRYLAGKSLEDKDKRGVEEIFQKAMRDFVS